jgi:hypothetical protein
MLRLVVLALLLLNVLYFGWSQGLLRGLGFAPAAQSEPQRLAQQIRPEALRVQPASEPAAPVKPASNPERPAAQCLQAGLFNEAQAAQLRSALPAAGLPEGTWLLQPSVVPARWIVYMGKYANAEALAKKRAELANLNLKLEPVNNPALQPGLSLGGFDSKAAADAALAAFNRRGVRTAQVLQERAEVSGTLLHLPAVDEALGAQLDALKPALAGKTLGPCP